jgi:Fe-S cluster assembly protein SufD
MSALTENKSLTGSFTAEAFAAHLVAQASAPAWWLDRKRAAYATFASLPFPKRTDESWRFSSIGTLTLDGFKVERVDPDALSPVSPFGPAHLTFTNNLLSAPPVLPAALAAQGVIVTTLAEAVAKHASLLQAHFMAQPQKLGSDKFASLHTASS